MKILDVILIGVALAMDAMTVTIANCLTYKNTLTLKKKMGMPLLFSLFQGVMPLIGFFIGSIFAGYLTNISGYLVSGVFFILATKILFDFITEMKSKAPEEEKPKKELTYLTILLQGFLTSIDALAVGLTLSLELTFSIYLAVALISGVTFIIVSLALIVGKYLGKAFDKYSALFGFFLLLFLAIKNLVESIL